MGRRSVGNAVTALEVALNLSIIFRIYDLHGASDRELI